MIDPPHPERPSEDDEWGAAPTHPDAGGPESVDEWTAEEPLPNAPAPETGSDWDAAPPLPIPLPTARPKAEREPEPVVRRGSRRGHRAPARRDDDRSRTADDAGADQADEQPRDAGRGRKADRPPPTAEERLQIALKHAYRYLTKRDRTEAEVRAHLEKRETDPASLEAAIAELLELRYLDDERYVQRYVEDRRRLDHWGPVRITQGLRKTGIDDALIAPAIAAVAEESDEDDVELATELVQRRFNHRPLDGDKDRQKALRAVVSKGHALDVAYAAVRAYEQRCAEDADG